MPTCQAAGAELRIGLNSYGYSLLEENQHICTGSNKIEGTVPELNFGISAFIFYEREG